MNATLDLTTIRRRVRSGRSIAKMPEIELRALAMLEIGRALARDEYGRIDRRHFLVRRNGTVAVLDIAGENARPAPCNRRLRRAGYRVIRVRSIAEVRLALLTLGRAD